MILGTTIRRNEIGAWGVRVLAFGLVAWCLFQASSLTFAGYAPDGRLRPAAIPVIGVAIAGVAFAAWAAWRAQPIGWWLARLLWPEHAGRRERTIALILGSAALVCLGRGAFDLMSVPTSMLVLDAIARGAGFTADTAWVGPAVALDAGLLVAGTLLLYSAARLGRRVL